MKPGNGVRKDVRLTPGAHEKGTGTDRGHPYPEPAQVPLGEKPKV